MNQKTGPLLKAVPFIYALIMALLLFYHFSRFENFSLVNKNISYMGTRTVETGLSPASIHKLNVFTNGLELAFSNRYRLKVITEDDITRSLMVQEINNLENGVELLFKYGIALRISSQNSDSTVEVSVPQTIPAVKEVVFNAFPNESFQISLEEKKGIMLSDGTSSYFLDSPSDLFYRENSLHVSMKDRVNVKVGLKDEAPGLGRTAFEWLSDEQKAVADSRTVIEEYRDKAYRGWTQRFDRSSGNLRMPEGAPAFSEQALVYFLSEIYNRNEYSLYAADMLRAAERNSSSLTWFSSPYTGDVVNRTAPLFRNAPSELLQRVNSLPLTGNAELSPYREIRELQSILDNPGETDPVLWIEERIFPLIVWLEEGIYIFHPENPVADTLYTLEAVSLLERAADITGDDQLTDLASELRASILSRADEEGNLPASIIFSRERASVEQGKIPAEVVFSLYLKENFSPRAIDLSSQLSPDSWIYTAADTASARKLGNSVEIDVNFPVGQTHHLAIKGVEPFDTIFLHGIRWKSDPRFQRYSDGWVYNSVTKTLYVKIRHRTARETIQINFPSPAPAAPAAPATPSPEGETGTADNG